MLEERWSVGGRARDARGVIRQHWKRCSGSVLKWLVSGALVLSLGTSSAWASSYFVSGQAGASINSVSFNLGIEGGLRLEEYGILGKVDLNPWFNSQDLKGSLKPGVLNVGVGGEYRYFNERCRSAVFVGPSILLFDTALDTKGTTGFFLDIITVSLRWPLGDVVTMRFDPATVHLVVPVLSGIPLISLQYRHTVAVEWSL